MLTACRSILLNAASCIYRQWSGRKKTVTVQSIMLNGNELSIAERMTILGVIITNNLSWTALASKVQAAISGRFSVLRRLGPVLNFITRLQLYKVFIKSSLLYYLPVWGNCPMTCQHTIDRTQGRCAHFGIHVNKAELPRNIFNITNICCLSQCVLVSNASTFF